MEPTSLRGRIVCGGSQRCDGTSIPHDALRQRRFFCANDGTMEDDPGWNQGAMIGWPGGDY